MIKSDEIKRILLEAPDKRHLVAESGVSSRKIDRQRQIQNLRSKINDSAYLEVALRKLAVDLAKEFY